jgi:N-acetylglucosamine malate deacetylase 2
MAATIYRVAKELGGKVDQAVITNGEGGYRYSALAEKYYGIPLTTEAVGRANLPDIRKQELLNAGKILGVATHWFLDQRDERYTQDIHEALDRLWNREFILTRLNEILTRGNYDFVFGLLPTPGTHGHHKAATLLALEAVSKLPQTARPVVLGCGLTGKNRPAQNPFTGLPEFPATNLLPAAPVFHFDRTSKFGFNNALDYQIIVNWMIAEHKSQGMFQTGYNWAQTEDYYVFAQDGVAGLDKTKQFFQAITPVAAKPQQQTATPDAPPHDR